MNMDKSKVVAAVLLTTALLFAGSARPASGWEPGVIDLAGTWRFRAGDDLAWAASELDETGWASMQVPGDWRSDPDHSDYWGFAWYRTRVQVPGSMVDAPLVELRVGEVREDAFFWVNGEFVGSAGSTVSSSCGPGEVRLAVPPEVLQPGDNTVAARIVAKGRCGRDAPSGINGGPVQLVATSTDRSGMPLRLVSDQPGHVAPLGQAHTFSASVHNSTGVPRQIVFDGPGGQTSVEVGPGDLGTATFSVTPSRLGPDQVEVRIADQEGELGVLRSAFGAIAPTEIGSVESSRFASNAIDETAQMAGAGTPTMQNNALSSRLGVGWMRYHFLPWRAVETSGPGMDNWSVWDHAIADAHANGTRLLLNPLVAPAWSGGQSGLFSQPPSEEHWDSWADFLRRAAERYPGQYWEIWNETDAVIFWAPIDHYAYFRFLKLSAEAIRSADPTAKIVLGGLAAVNTGPFYSVSPTKPLPLAPSYPEGLMMHGACDYFDVFNHHMYGSPSSQDFEDKARIAQEILAKYECDKPIWVTEVGEELSGPSEPSRPAQSLGRMFALLDAYGTDRFFQFHSIDYPGDLPWGYWDTNLQPRPAAFAQAALTSLLEGMPQPRLVTIDGVRGVHYEAADQATPSTVSNPSASQRDQVRGQAGSTRTVTVIWDDERRTINVPAGTRILDHFGNEVPSPDGRIQLGPSTTYLVSD